MATAAKTFEYSVRDGNLFTTRKQPIGMKAVKTFVNPTRRGANLADDFAGNAGFAQDFGRPGEVGLALHELFQI